MTAAVEITGLTKRFGDQREVLRSIAMRIDAGERVALLGDSGNRSCSKGELLAFSRGEFLMVLVTAMAT